MVITTRRRIGQNTGVRWHYRDAGLLWLFVPAYLVHLAEEWFAGFPACHNGTAAG
jgi:hypothetical protein